MKCFFCAAFLWLGCYFSYAQVANTLPSSVSIANTATANASQWSGFDNPANLAFVPQAEFSLQYENRFIIKELSTKSFSFALPTSFVNTSFSFSHFGFSAYNEMLVGVSFARNYRDKFSMGLQLNCLAAYHPVDNNYRLAFVPNLGITTKLSEKVTVAFSAFNPFHQQIASDFEDSALPAIFSLGVSYGLSPELTWRSQLDKEISSTLRVASGFEYFFKEKMMFKLGVYSHDYLVFCGGVGFVWDALRFDCNVDVHPILGVSPVGRLSYRFANHKNR